VTSVAFTIRRKLTCNGPADRRHAPVTIQPQPGLLTGAWCGVCGRSFKGLISEVAA
jgi:hypothetical protein